MKTLQRVHKWVNTFNTEEWKGLVNFVKILKRPRSTQSEKIIRLLRDVDEAKYEVNEKKYVQKARKILFGIQKEVDPTQFANKIRFLIEFIESYSIYLHTNNDKQAKKIILKDILYHRNLHDERIRVRNSFLKHYDTTNKNGIWQLHQQFHVLHNKYHDVTNNTEVNDSKKGETSFREMNHKLDEFIIISKIKMACEALIRKLVLNENHNVNFLEEIKIKAKASNLPLVQMYFQVFQLILGQADWSLLEIKEFIKKNKQNIFFEDFSFLLIQLTNYISLSINKNKNLQSGALEVYQMYLEAEHIEQKKEMQPAYLINVITLAISLADLKWAKETLINYKRYLPKLNRENVYDLLQASILIEEKCWKEAALLLNQINIKDWYLGSRVYNYQIICAFEDDYLNQKDTEILKLHLNRFLKYIEKQVIDEHYTLMYKNMVEVVKKLIKNNVNYELLLIEVKSMKLIASRKWLYQKLNKEKSTN